MLLRGYRAVEFHGQPRRCLSYAPTFRDDCPARVIDAAAAEGRKGSESLQLALGGVKVDSRAMARVAEMGEVHATIPGGSGSRPIRWRAVSFGNAVAGPRRCKMRDSEFDQER